MTPMSTETYFDDARMDGRKVRTTLSPKTSPDGFEHYELLPQSNCIHRRCSHNNHVTHPSEQHCGNNSVDDFRYLNQYGTRENGGGESDRYVHQGGLEHVNEWHCMAEILDRVFLVVFIIGIVVPTSIILGFIRLFKPEL